MVMKSDLYWRLSKGVSGHESDLDEGIVDSRMRVKGHGNFYLRDDGDILGLYVDGVDRPICYFSSTGATQEAILKEVVKYETMMG
jgi:hypothetical protein